MGGKAIARGLAWFGIGLGLWELCAPQSVAQATGLDKHADVIRLFGIREILSGALILAAADPRSWLWTRVIGDGLDGALLASGLNDTNSRRDKALMAMLAVAPVALLDYVYAQRPR
jgi:hypothetical protein